MKDANVLHSLLKHNSHSSNDKRHKACFLADNTSLSQKREFEKPLASRKVGN